MPCWCWFYCSRRFWARTASLLPQVVPREQLAAAIVANSMLMRAGQHWRALCWVGCCMRWSGAGDHARLFLGGLRWHRAAVTRCHLCRPAMQRAATVHHVGNGLAQVSVSSASRPIIPGDHFAGSFAVLLGGWWPLLPIYASEGAVRHWRAGLRQCLAVGEVVRPVSQHAPLQPQGGAHLFVAVAVFGLANLLFAVSTGSGCRSRPCWRRRRRHGQRLHPRGALVQFSTPDHMRGRRERGQHAVHRLIHELVSSALTPALPLGVVPAAALAGCARWRGGDEPWASNNCAR